MVTIIETGGGGDEENVSTEFISSRSELGENGFKENGDGKSEEEIQEFLLISGFIVSGGVSGRRRTDVDITGKEKAIDEGEAIGCISTRRDFGVERGFKFVAGSVNMIHNVHSDRDEVREDIHDEYIRKVFLSTRGFDVLGDEVVLGIDSRDLLKLNMFRKISDL